MEPDFKIQLGENRWLLIEVKGGKPTRTDFVKLEMFAKFQRQLLELQDDEAAPPVPPMPEGYSDPEADEFSSLA